MLALKDRDHVVNASLPGLADYARISLAKCKEALEILKAPDEFSSSKEFGGRRIREVDGGWEILNGEKYHQKLSKLEKDEKNAIRQARWREKQARLKAEKEKQDAAWAAKNGPELKETEPNGEMDGSLAAVAAGKKKIADRKARALAKEEAALKEYNETTPGREEREAAREKEISEINARMAAGEPPPEPDQAGPEGLV